MRLILLLFLCSCVPQPAAVLPPKLIQFTEADLSNAITIAQASNEPKAPFIVSCFTFLKTQLTSVSAPTGTIGVATAFTLADLASGTTAVPFASACGPLIALTTYQGLSLAQQVQTLGFLIAPKG